MKLQDPLVAPEFSLMADRRAGGRNGAAPAPDRALAPSSATRFATASRLTRLNESQSFSRTAGREAVADFLDFLDRLPEAIFLLDPEDPDGFDSVVECSGLTYAGHHRPFKWSLSWLIRNCNEQACNQNGYNREELIGQPAGLVGPIVDQWDLLAELPEKLVQERYVRFEALHQRKDRTLFAVEVSATMVLLESRPLVLCIERELPRWKLPEAHQDKRGPGSAEGVNPVMEFDTRGSLTYYNAATSQLACALGQSTPVALVPPGMAALVKERLETGTQHLGLETRMGQRTLSWALFPNPANATVYAYVSDITDWVRQTRSPELLSDSVTRGTEPGLVSQVATPVSTARNDRPVQRVTPLTGDTTLDAPEQVFQRLVRASGDPIIEFDLDEKIQRFNPAAEELTGIPASSAIGRPYSSLNLLTPESLAAMSGVLAQVIAGQPTLPIEQVMVRKDGHRLVVEANFRAIREGTRVVGALVTLRDLTERKLVEERLRERESRLVWAQRIGQMGSWAWQGDESSLDWSPEAFRIFGCEPGKFTPTRSAMFELIHPANRELVKQTADCAWRTGTAYRLEYRVIQPGGVQRIVQEQAEVISDESGKPACMIGAIQDITERKQQEEQVRHLEKWEAIGRLAGGVAHDFNNILADIRRCIEVIQASAPNIKDEIAVQLKALATTAERATSLTWQLLAYSRKPVIQSKPVNLNVLINQTTDTLRRVLGEEIDLQLKLIPELPTISADMSMLEQVFLNLAINSRHAMKEGGRLLIETRVASIDAAYVQQRPDASVGQFVCLGITALGTGLDSAATACIFEPFFTTKQLGQSAGLVLATVYSIIKQHQGWIDVFREVERGATFKIYLPVRDQAVELPADDSAPDLICGGKETILLVEDEPLLRALAQSILERYGYQILPAGSGAEALTVWERQTDKIDLLLTDVAMPGGMTGQDLARQLQVKKPQLKVVFTTGYNVESIPRDLPLKPGLNFIPKPYSASALAQTVRSCLDQGAASKDPDSRRLKLA